MAVKKRSEFPENEDEFLVLLKALKVKNPDAWMYGEFDKNRVMVFLFLWGLWQLIPNPNEAEKQLENQIGTALRHQELNPNSECCIPEENPIISKWLAQGIDPKEIVTVMRASAVNAIYGLLQNISQPSDFKHGIERYYGLFGVEMDEDFEPTVAPDSPPIEHDIADFLQQAMPEDQPDMPYWV